METSQIVTLSISATALLISGFGWYESHRNRQLAQATSRATLYVSAIKLAAVKLGGGEIQMDIENSGKATANKVRFRYRVIVTVGSDSLNTPSESGTVGEYQEFIVQTIPPGKTITKKFLFELPQKPLGTRWPTLIMMGGTLFSPTMMRVRAGHFAKARPIRALF